MSSSSAPQYHCAFIGLGNVGAQYTNTRHNIGFDAVDGLASELGVTFHPGRGEYFVAEFDPREKGPPPNLFWRVFPSVWQMLQRESGRRAEPSQIAASLRPCVLIKPTTLMNLSGRAARQALDRYHLDILRLVVICDDFNLPLGSLRLRASGSDGGHRGLRSLIAEFGTEDFPRLRLGIGPKPNDTPVTDFVLGRFSAAEGALRDNAITAAASACKTLLSNDFTKGLDIAASLHNITADEPAPGSGA